MGNDVNKLKNILGSLKGSREGLTKEGGNVKKEFSPQIM